MEVLDKPSLGRSAADCQKFSQPDAYGVPTSVHNSLNMSVFLLLFLFCLFLFVCLFIGDLHNTKWGIFSHITKNLL